MNVQEERPASSLDSSHTAPQLLGAETPAKVTAIGLRMREVAGLQTPLERHSAGTAGGNGCGSVILTRHLRPV